MNFVLGLEVRAAPRRENVCMHLSSSGLVFFDICFLVSDTSGMQMLYTQSDCSACLRLTFIILTEYHVHCVKKIDAGLIGGGR
jgi:hypothetical protein